MCRLVESIKLIDGELPDLAYHNARFNRSRRDYFGIEHDINLADFLLVPPVYRAGLFKVRVVYDAALHGIEYLPYEKRSVAKVRLVDGGTIDYSFKYENRDELNELYSKRGDGDDVLIIKNGCISDFSSSNTAFYDGERWYTSDTPLLSGTKRARLLAEKKIFEKRITVRDIRNYKKVSLINAMIDLEEIVIDVDDIL